MKTIRRLIYGEVLSAIALVALGFLALFFFFDLADELQYLGRPNLLNLTGEPKSFYELRHALLYVLLLVPNHLYELMPISVLIGSIFVMSRLAQSSEFTILRTSGLGPWRALGLLLGLGLAFTVLSFAIGDYVAPASERAAQLLKARYQGQITVGQTGAWLREKQANTNYIVNVKALSATGSLQEVQIFEFDNLGRTVSTTRAPAAVFAPEGNAWLLTNANLTEFSIPSSAALDNATARIRQSTVPTLRWPTSLSLEMVSVSLLKPERMRALDLFTYIRHLEANGQTAQRYEIEFWKKIFYPLGCLVMVVLALPFAYLHLRSGGIAGFVFAGIMIGISFFLLNNVFGYIGNLRNWQPWLAAATPGLVYMAVSLAALRWLVLRR